MVKFFASCCRVEQSGAREIDLVLNRDLLPLLTEKLLNVEDNKKMALLLNVNKDKLTLS